MIFTICWVTIQNVNASSFPSASSLQPIPITGPQKLAVILVQFPDAIHDPNYDVATILDNFKEYFKKNSYGKMWFDVDVSPTWYTMPYNLKDYNNEPSLQTNIFQHAADAASKDLDLSKYGKILVIYATPRSSTIPPPNYPYNFQWMAHVPYTIKVNNEDHHIEGAATVDVYVDGSPAISLMIHEFAHGGLYLPDLHTPVLSTVLDAMSSPLPPMPLGFCSWTKLALGWLDQRNVFTVSDGSKETVKIDALGLDPTGISVVKIPVTDKRFYLIEVREPVGVDSRLAVLQAGARISDRHYASGVFVLEINENFAMRQGVVKWINPKTQQPVTGQLEADSVAFLVGESFSNPYFGKMTVKSKSGNTYEVEIDRTSTQPFVERDFVIKTDKSTYTTGDTVIFSGTVPEVGVVGPVWTVVYAPSCKSYGGPTATPNSDRSFTTNGMVLNYFMAEGGVWKVEAHYGNWIKQFSYEVNPKQTTPKQEVAKVAEQKTPVIEGNLTIKTDKSRYVTGDTVIFSGKVSQVITDQAVRLKMYTPSGKSYQIGDYPSKDGEFTIKALVLYDFMAESGVWKGEAHYVEWATKQFSFEVNTKQTTQKQDVTKVAEKKIPQWIKNNAGWFAEGSIGESDFTKGIEYMIKEGIMNIPNLQEKASKKTETKVPSWIKNNAKWWSEGKISDDDFVKGIQYLVEKGIIEVK